MTEVNPTPQDREIAEEVNNWVGDKRIEMARMFMHARLQGRREALEEAARVAEECPIDLPLAPGLSCGAVAASRQIATAIRAIANKP